MKAKVYVRLARNPTGQTPFKVAANVKPNPAPLTVGQGYSERSLHTLHFALVLDVPDELLAPAQWPVVEVALTTDDATQLPEVVEVEAVP